MTINKKIQFMLSTAVHKSGRLDLLHRIYVDDTFNEGFKNVDHHV